MQNNSEICIICEEAPCECKKTRTAKKRAPRSSPPPVASGTPRKTVHRVVGRGTPVEASEVTNVEQPAAEDPDGLEEDDELIYATRLLAHLIDPEDPNLKALGDAILPSDRLPPEDRISDWKRRVGGS